MRFKVAAFVLVAVFLSTALTSHATSVAPRKNSNYGQGHPNLDFEMSNTYTGDNGVDFTEFLVCTVSAISSCPGNDSSLDGSDYSLILAINSAVPAGTTVAINGLTGFDPTADLVGEVTCDASTPGVNNLPCVSSANSACETALATAAASNGSLTIPSACLSKGEALYIDFVDASSPPDFVKPTVTPSGVTAPEPGMMVMVMAGILGVFSRRRLRA
jgi:PEP-CTERM motif